MRGWKPGTSSGTDRLRHTAKAKVAKTPDELTLEKVMVKSYRTVSAQREEGVRRTLPKDVLASYVEAV